MLYVIFLWLIYFIMGSLNLLISFSCVNLKKCTVSELQVKFYLGQNEDCSPGDSTSNSSERLLQRGRGERQYICDFGKGGIHAIRHRFFQKVSAHLVKLSASHEEQLLPWRILVLSWVWEDTRIGLRKISSWKYLFEDLSCQFSPEHRCLISALYSELLSWGVEGQQLQ